MIDSRVDCEPEASGARRLVSEARRNELIEAEEAGNLSDIPNVAQRGNGMGDRLTRDRSW